MAEETITWFLKIEDAIRWIRDEEHITEELCAITWGHRMYLYVKEIDWVAQGDPLCYVSLA